jgi:hypothetical protein
MAEYATKGSVRVFRVDNFAGVGFAAQI